MEAQPSSQVLNFLTEKTLCSVKIDWEKLRVIKDFNLGRNRSYLGCLVQVGNQIKISKNETRGRDGGKERERQRERQSEIQIYNRSHDDKDKDYSESGCFCAIAELVFNVLLSNGKGHGPYHPLSNFVSILPMLRRFFFSLLLVQFSSYSFDLS